MLCLNELLKIKKKTNNDNKYAINYYLRSFETAWTHSYIWLPRFTNGSPFTFSEEVAPVSPRKAEFLPVFVIYAWVFGHGGERRAAHHVMDQVFWDGNLKKKSLKQGPKDLL